MAPMCDQGFSPSMGGAPAPRARIESGKGNTVKGAKEAADRKGSEVTPKKAKESVYSTRLPKISHAELQMPSSPP
jgi:hypothetical protein